MSELQEALDQYLSLRRSLGFQLRKVEAPLRSFIAFAEEKGASYITPDLMLRWAQQPSKAQPATNNPQTTGRPNIRCPGLILFMSTSCLLW